MSTSSPTVAPTMSNDRFRNCAEGESFGIGSPISGNPSIVWNWALVPTTSNSRGTMSTCNSEPLQRPDHLEALLVRVRRECNHHAIDRMRPDDLRQRLDRSDQLDGFGGGSVPGCVRVTIDESDEVQPVFRVLHHLRRQLLCHLAGTHDHDLLDVFGTSAPDRTGARTEQRDEDDAGRPEGDQSRERWVHDPRYVCDREERPDAGRHHLEHLDEVVDGGVVAPLLVGVVEAADLCEDDPDRHGQPEERELPRRSDAAVDGRRGRDCEREDEGKSEARDVGSDQEPVHEPCTRPRRGRGQAHRLLQND